MKLCLSLMIVVLFVVDANAQPLPENITWRNLDPSSEEFSIEVPIDPNAFTAITPELTYYRGRFGDTYLYIYSETIIMSGWPSRLMGVRNEYIARVVRHYDNQWVGVIKSGSFNTFTFSESDGFFHNVAMTRTKTRVYTFHTISTKRDDPIVKRFYRSLKVGDATVKEIDTSKTAETASEVNLNGSNADLNSISASRVVQSVAPNIESTPLEITFTPVAPRTGFAKFYGIEGTVSLRVSFQANGKIGEIVPLKRLPFELTKNAIIAAKKIRFRPALNGSRPVTVTRTVNYVFTKED